MRVFHVTAEQFSELPSLPDAPPASGFIWVGSARGEFERQLPALQALLTQWTGAPLVELHVSDLLNPQLPSHFDTTSWYDLLVFRRLVAAASDTGPDPTAALAVEPVDTSPVGFAVFDRLLLTVHPADCAVRDFFAHRLTLLSNGAEPRGATRLPPSPADLMLRMVNHMVDSYLELRRLLTRQLGLLQQELMRPNSHFHDWQLLLDARNRLHLLEDTCEDQQGALQEWIDALVEWEVPSDATARRERELLRLRSRDVLEHIERVLAHVRRLEQSVEAAVQMHFSALGHRTNAIMRTLTVLTAIFLPLNLITGFFGMNFDSLPLIHSARGVWITIGALVVVALGLGLFFWRKRYLGTQVR